MSTLFADTPTVAVRDGRGLSVRAVSYNRTSAADAVEARIMRQEFDALGHAMSSIDARLFAAGGLPNLRQASALSRQALRIESVDASMRWSLTDVCGLLVLGEDGKGQRQRYTYDVLGRPKAIYERNAGGDESCRERLIYGENMQQAAGRNLRGQLMRAYHTGGCREIGAYGLNGQALSGATRFLKALTVPDWPANQAESEALLEDEVYSSIRRYGASGEVLEHVDAVGHARQWAFDVSGQLKSSLLRAQGAFSAIEVQDGLRYDALGSVLEARDGNGATRRYEYEAATRRLRRMLARRESDGLVLQDLKYGYDPVGNVASIEDASQPSQYFRNQKVDPISRYAYDALYQLIEASGRESAAGGQQGDAQWPESVPLKDAGRLVNYTRQYEYDAGGNLLGYAHRGASEFKLVMVVSAVSNRAVKKSDNAKQDVESGFDENGNLKQLEGRPLAWDARNQLSRTVQIEHDDGTADDEVYVYDGAGQRARKVRRWKAGGQWQVEEVRYLAGLELRERRQTNQDGGEAKITERWQVAMHGEARLLHWAQGLPDGLGNDRLRYGLSDHLGSSVLELDEAGQVISREEYYPYGGTALWAGRSEVEADYKTVRYSGKERDHAGLYYYGYRYYAPWWARWLNPDPGNNIDGLNLFRMVRNNPVALIDADGLAPKGCFGFLKIKRRNPGSNKEGAIGEPPSTPLDAPSEIRRPTEREYKPFLEMQIHYRGENERGVRYLDDIGRAALEVTVSEHGLLMYRQTGRVVGENAPESGDFSHWKFYQKAYVISTEDRMYANAHEVGRFHHSSFMAGGNVKDAGMITVARGKVLNIDAKSGHYRPDKAQKLATVDYLMERGADMSEAFVLPDMGMDFIWNRPLYRATSFYRKGLEATPLDLTVAGVPDTGVGQAWREKRIAKVKEITKFHVKAAA